MPPVLLQLDGPPSGVVGDAAAGTTLTVSVISAMDLIGAQEWDDVAGPTGNPFLSHAFLNALEQSGSACQVLLTSSPTSLPRG